jgi:hypothetical protein
MSWLDEGRVSLAGRDAEIRSGGSAVVSEAAPHRARATALRDK